MRTSLVCSVDCVHPARSSVRCVLRSVFCVYIEPCLTLNSSFPGAPHGNQTGFIFGISTSLLAQSPSQPVQRRSLPRALMGKAPLEPTTASPGSSSMAPLMTPSKPGNNGAGLQVHATLQVTIQLQTPSANLLIIRTGSIKARKKLPCFGIRAGC